MSHIDIGLCHLFPHNEMGTNIHIMRIFVFTTFWYCSHRCADIYSLSYWFEDSISYWCLLYFLFIFAHWFSPFQFSFVNRPLCTGQWKYCQKLMNSCCFYSLFPYLFFFLFRQCINNCTLNQNWNWKYTIWEFIYFLSIVIYFYVFILAALQYLFFILTVLLFGSIFLLCLYVSCARDCNVKTMGSTQI